MSMREIFGFLIFGFLLAGCIGTPAGTQETGNNTSTTESATTGGSTGGTTSGGTDAASIATYTAAVASGLPMECIVTQQGQTTTIFIKGQKMFFTGTSGNEQYEVISKDDYVYMKMSASMQQSFAQMNKSCDWLKMGGANETSSSGSSSPISPSDYEASSAAWNCNLATFGDEKFATTGDICTMEDLYAGAYTMN